jgi:hypothetical protein
VRAVINVMHRSAVISECGRYRYKLQRAWTPSPLCFVGWVMLNPSTADADIDDPTIRRCMAFSESWGFHGMYVANLYAYRSTDPSFLSRMASDIASGIENDGHLADIALMSDRVICAWGVPGGKLIPEALWPYREKCYHLGLTASGAPKHPLYLAKTTPMTSLAIV